MSGIIGIYFFDGRPIEKSDLEKMLNSILYRGPDKNGIWHEGAVGLGNCLLCTTPESENERLPLVSRDGNLVLVADARIDNRDELLPTLNISNKFISDSEIIMASYEMWGEDCPKKLIGDFAFALWDKRHHKLFCARDALGIRPFYYYQADNFLAFASSSEAIFPFSQVKKRLNLEALIDFLFLNFSDFETEFEKLYRLRPAHSLIVKNYLLKCTKYWDVDPNYVLKLKRKEEYEEVFRDVFNKSLTAKLRSNSHIGMLLSGGLDSSSIMCMIEDLKSQNKIATDICAYSAIYPGEPFDEKDYILSIQKKWGTKVHWVEPKMPEIPWESQNALCKDSQPFWDNTYILEDLTTKAKQNNAKVLLSGLGGDEFIDLSLSLATDLLLAGRISSAWNYSIKFLKFQDASYMYALRNILPELCKEFIPTFLKKLRTSLYVHKTCPWLSKHYKKLAVKRLRTKPQFLKEHKFTNNTSKSLYTTLHSGNRIRILEDWERTIFHTAPIEFRLPFCDRRLVELAFSLPKEEIVRGNKPKGFMQAVFGSYLTEEIRERNWKAASTIYTNQQLIQNDSKKIKELLTSSYLEHIGFVNGKVARSEYNDFCQKYINNVNKTKDAISSLYLLLYLESWLKIEYDLSNSKK